jgi:chemotaxis family two-component system response regulator Rcp1
MVHILLAEDNLADVLLVERALDAHHIAHELHVVKDGGEALAFVARMGKDDATPCPDVFLLDLNLPKAEGHEILREFRKHPACVHTPVIAVTSSDMPKDRMQMAELGVDRYFRKPSDLEAFLKLGMVIREVIATRQD